MDIPELVAAFLGGGALGAVLTWWASTRDLALRRRIETMNAFLKIAARAHGYREGHEDMTVGTGEQSAAMFLVADLATRDKWLREAAIQLLDEEISWLEHPRLLNAAKEARTRIR